jgi:hypothetical protein
MQRCRVAMCVLLGNVRALSARLDQQRFFLGPAIHREEIRGSIGALLGRESGFKAVGRMITLEPFSAGRRGPEPQDTWQHQSPPR